MISQETASELTRTAYNIAADKYHLQFKDELLEKEYDRNLLDEFTSNLNQDSIILDAGCGPSGHTGRYLFDKGYKITGIDISDKCIEIAKNYNPGIEFIRMDISNLHFGEDSFDGIISFYSIIHTPKKYIEMIFNEFYRVLKPDGKLLVSVKAGDEERCIDNFLETDAAIYFSLFNEDEIKNYFEQSGFNLLFIEKRTPLKGEIDIERIYAIGKKQFR